MCIHPRFTVADIDSACDRLKELATRGEPHAHCTDLIQLDPLFTSAVHRKHFAERERALYPIGQGHVVADVRIVDNQLVRGVLTAFQWLAGEAPWPVRNVATPGEASAWLGTFDRLRL